MYLNSILEIKNFGFRSHIDQMRPAVEEHVGEKFCFVNLAIFGAGGADTDWDMVLYQIGEIIIRAVTSLCLLGKIFVLIGPQYAIIYQKNIYNMTFGMSNFGELKTPRCFNIVILT